MGREGDTGQAVQPCFAKGHDRKKRPVHHGESYVFQRLIYRAEDDLTQLVFDPEGLQAEKAVDLVDPGVSRVQ